jgi:stage II sporulation protein P
MRGMYKSNKDEFLLKITFFVIGVLMLLRIVIPIINPVSVATDIRANDTGFFKQVINKSNAAVETAMHTMEDEDKKDLFTIVFKYVTDIDLSNPRSFIASQIPLLGLIDLTYIAQNEDGPVVVVPNTTIEENENSEDHSEPENQPPQSGQPTTPPKEVIPNQEKPIKKITLNPSKPLILIYHTHTTENYNPSQKKDENFSTNTNIGVCKVGTELEKELESKYGIATLHDTTVHDIPKRDGAYAKSRPTVQSYLKKYPSLQIVIDLHRDAIDANKVTAIINKEKYARVMFVVGTDHKNYKKNIELVQKLNNTFNKLYPGFSRGISYRDNAKFNQDLSAKNVLLELGSHLTSLEDGLRSVKLIARVLAENIK